MFALGEPQRRTARGEHDPQGPGPRFTEAQRIWLLERDLDEGDAYDEAFKREVREELKAIRKLVSSRLNWIVGLGFTLLITVVVALLTAVISAGGSS